MTGRVYLGACDWRHPAWCGSFYPDDMPEEWHLAFYSTQYSCVWLSRATWHAARDFEDWLGEVGAGFRFLLEGSRQDAADVQEGLVGGEAGPLLVADEDAGIIWFDVDTDLSELTACIKASPVSEPVYLISRDANLDSMGQVALLLELLGL